LVAWFFVRGLDLPGLVVYLAPNSLRTKPM
jgi:hypothetical protein